MDLLFAPWHEVLNEREFMREYIAHDSKTLSATA